MTDEIKIVNGVTLHRIKALISFDDIKKGEIGGWIEKEENLDHHGNAWVSGNAWVWGDAWVSGDAMAFGNSKVFGKARVFGNTVVSENTILKGGTI